jgi:hypothetical protein
VSLQREIFLIEHPGEWKEGAGMARYTGGMQGIYWNPAHAPAPADERRGGEGNLHEPQPIRPLDPLAPVGHELDLLLRYLPTGFALFAYGVAKQVRERVKQSAIELAATLQPVQSSAGEAYFTGKPGEEEEKRGEESIEAETSPELERLDKEIAERKQQG